MGNVKAVPSVWFTDEQARWRPTHTTGVDDVTRWAFDDAGRIWLTAVSSHSSAQPGADPSERRVYPALLLENAVRTVHDALGTDPFPWDVIDVVSNPGPPEDYLPVLGRGRMVINGRLYLGTTVQVDSSIFVATVIDAMWIGALQPRSRHHPKLSLQPSAADPLIRTI
ncbi:UNVERIFIED_CONTAM: hypothetical protein DES50_11181 [Williamsia faeni]